MDRFWWNRMFCCLLITLLQADMGAQEKKGQTKKRSPFQWVNKLPEGSWPRGLTHETFRSPSMNREVGYCIYLPPEYRTSKQKKFPVVYYLHGGRPGNETKSVRLSRLIAEAMESQRVPDMIYVFVNGGKVSHYNTPQFDSLGEDVFVRELIPHVDSRYRTLSDRKNRGLEGFSQGGRGTARIMFKHPQLFWSCSPGGAGQATEKKISENDGRESEKLKFARGDNTWDLARRYSRNKAPSLRILIHVGSLGFNYRNNLEYMKFLDSLGIPYQKLVIPEVPHSASKIYEKEGEQLMRFHAKNFGLLR